MASTSELTYANVMISCNKILFTIVRDLHAVRHAIKYIEQYVACVNKLLNKFNPPIPSFMNDLCPLNDFLINSNGFE